MLRALRVRNFRLWYLGGLVSVTGTWMQVVAQSWFVLELSGSAAALGLTLTAQALPAALLAPWGGVLADRHSRRRLLAVTQSAHLALAAILTLLAWSGATWLWGCGPSPRSAAW